MDGIIRCSRYSFGPNRLHYCGPDANAELETYIESGETDPGLSKILKQFHTLFPYLNHIAKANKIADPFDERVVEAYWLGNSLLDIEEKNDLYRFLIDDLKIRDIIGGKEFSFVENKISRGAVPHHSFHVFNLWRRMDNKTIPHTLHNLDECRVSSGTIVSADGPEIIVMTEPLIYSDGKFYLGEPIKKRLIRTLESEYDIEQLLPGQLISIHWSVPCEVISPEQSAALKKYTLQNIAFANHTL